MFNTELWTAAAPRWLATPRKLHARPAVLDAQENPRPPTVNPRRHFRRPGIPPPKTAKSPPPRRGSAEPTPSPPLSVGIDAPTNPMKSRIRFANQRRRAPPPPRQRESYGRIPHAEIPTTATWRYQARAGSGGRKGDLACPSAILAAGLAGGGVWGGERKRDTERERERGRESQ